MNRIYANHRPGQRLIHIECDETEIYGLLHDLNPSVLPTLLFGMSEPFVGLAHPGGPGVAFSPLPTVAGIDSPPGPHDDSAAH